jgi:hypothetical protein
MSVKSIGRHSQLKAFRPEGIRTVSFKEGIRTDFWGQGIPTGSPCSIYRSEKEQKGYESPYGTPHSPPLIRN